MQPIVKVNGGGVMIGNSTGQSMFHTLPQAVADRVRQLSA
jgi:hypothetical protein